MQEDYSAESYTQEELEMASVSARIVSLSDLSKPINDAQTGGLFYDYHIANGGNMVYIIFARRVTRLHVRLIT